MGVEGFNPAQFVPDRNEFQPLDKRAVIDRERLMKAFPADWHTKSDAELLACAKKGLSGAKSAYFTAMTPQDVVTCLRETLEAHRPGLA